jgi:hypothetical protein
MWSPIRARSNWPMAAMTADTTGQLSVRQSAGWFSGVPGSHGRIQAGSIAGKIEYF